jgi:putative redox protein
MLRAHVELTDPAAGNRSFMAHDLRGHQVPLDDVQGNTGAKPIELVLMALAGCTAFDVITILRKKRHAITTYCVEVSAAQADVPPQVCTKVELCHVVECPTLKLADARAAVELSERKYCAVGAMLRKAVEIRTTLRLNGELYDLNSKEANEQVEGAVA